MAQGAIYILVLLQTILVAVNAGQVICNIACIKPPCENPLPPPPGQCCPVCPKKICNIACIKPPCDNPLPPPSPLANAVQFVQRKSALNYALSRRVIIHSLLAVGSAAPDVPWIAVSFVVQRPRVITLSLLAVENAALGVHLLATTSNIYP
ncbi:hypothetical protein EMCRGX_G010321 [Ephydatia muelleri]